MNNSETISFTAKDGTSVTLRPAGPDDAFDIITNVEEIIQQGRYIQKEHVRTVEEEQSFIREMRAENNMYTVVEIDKRVYGIARLLRGELKMKRHTALFRTWLATPAQGKGLGKKLMEYTLEWGKKNGLYKICLTVFAKNEVAVNLYEQYGFVKEGVQKDQVFIEGEYDDEIFMAYFIDENRS
ncbi:GNAT family N-acetyltransferase [Alteribacter lacisalsi]|uniref:GNAT family N-acetyltransferase n=1 Tax=Alteribacter lacisalsi TaxID=2045244 RepID=A0A2W0HCF6_9BACI|nr:GNAT family protein [Alteribacter lacisalsi]PYZ98536.1 GNAT family N-acetyltransferase [Alteribacter lacisalsi]